jgi:hypothetical protein
MRSTIIIAVIINLFCSFNLGAITKIDYECRSRVEIIDKQLGGVLNLKKYDYKHQRSVKNAIKKAQLDHGKYKSYISSFDDIMAQRNINNSKAVECLLSTGVMIGKLNKIAHAGHKNLNHFSPNWKKEFPGYAKQMGYNI